MIGNATAEPRILPIELVRNTNRHLRILFLYQPLKLDASSLIVSKSFT